MSAPSQHHASSMKSCIASEQGQGGWSPLSPDPFPHKSVALAHAACREKPSRHASCSSSARPCAGAVPPSDFWRASGPALALPLPLVAALAPLLARSRASRSFVAGPLTRCGPLGAGADTWCGLQARKRAYFLRPPRRLCSPPLRPRQKPAVAGGCAETCPR
jgi:hypothetical protein